MTRLLVMVITMLFSRLWFVHVVLFSVLCFPVSVSCLLINHVILLSPRLGLVFIYIVATPISDKIDWYCCISQNGFLLNMAASHCKVAKIKHSNDLLFKPVQVWLKQTFHMCIIGRKTHFWSFFINFFLRILHELVPSNYRCKGQIN